MLHVHDGVKEANNTILYIYILLWLVSALVSLLPLEESPKFDMC